MQERLVGWWLRLRNWVAVRLGRWRGRWSDGSLEAPAAHWGWWPWPGSQRAWDYALYQPARLRDDTPAPLLVLLHGCRQEARAFAQASGWVAAAEREGVRLLCPQQRRGANPYGCWNWFQPAAQVGRGELDVVRAALDATLAAHPTTRVAAIGLSAGGGLAALLAFHAAERLDAAIAVAAPPLLGPLSLQDPRQVMRHGLAISPAIAVHGLRACAPLLVLQGEADDVVDTCCAAQLTEQACNVLERAHAAAGRLREIAMDDGRQWLAGDALVLRSVRLPGLGHAWTGGPGGHAYVLRDGPPLTAMCLQFLCDTGVLRAAAAQSG